MKKLIDYFVENSFIVNLISITVLVVGAVSATFLHRDLTPPVKFSEIRVYSHLPGASAVQVEKNLTIKIEESLSGLVGLKAITSESKLDSSEVKLTFKSGTDMEKSLELVNARIQGIKHELPMDLESIEAQITEVNETYLGELGVTGFEEKNVDHQIWYENFKGKLNRVPGISSVSGSIERQRLYINLRFADLENYGLSIPFVRKKISEAMSYFPIGEVESNFKQFIVELDWGLNSLESISEIPMKVTMDGSKIKLSDIADVSYGLPEKRSVLYSDGQPNHFIQLLKNLNSDQISLNKKISEFIEAEKLNFPKGVDVYKLFDGSVFIERQLNVLKSNGALGFLLVILLLGALTGFRTAMMAAMGIPLAYLGSILVLYWMEISINLVSVIAMILIIGVLVDDAIIVAEKYATNLTKGMSRKDAAKDAAYVLIKPVTGTVLTTIIAFSPILFIEGEMMAVMMSIPIVIITALTVSWIECFFILPNHLQHFVKSAATKRMEWMDRLAKSYGRLLIQVLRYRYLSLVASLGLFAGAV